MKPIYLEPNEEITSVIEKISAEGDGVLALVVPKNSSLFQSLVNLKLLAKEAKNLGKEVVIVSGNKVGERLAKQVGIQTYATLGNADSSKPSSAPAPEAAPSAAPDTTIDGVPVRQYNPNRPGAEEVVEPPTEAVESEPAVEPAPEPVAVSNDAEPIEAPAVEPKTEAAPVADRQQPEVELPPVMARSGVLRTTERTFHFSWKSFAIAAGIFLVITAVLFLLLPKATVTAQLPAESVSSKLALSLQSTAAGDETLVGSLTESEQSATATITATGQKDVGTKASGSVTITNKYRDSNGAGKDQSFAAGTKVTDSSSKKVFTLNSAVTVSRVTFNPNNGQPIYDSKSVKVTAVEPGESYNIAKSSFTIAGALDNTIVESSEAFTGGLTKQITVLSQEDLDGAVTKLRGELDAKGKADLQQKTQGLTILDAAIWATVTAQTTDKNVGDEADKVGLSLTVSYGTFAYDQAALDEKIRSSLAPNVPDGKELVLPTERPPTITVTQVSEDKSHVSLAVDSVGFVVDKLDKSAVAKQLKNRSIQSAKDFLQQKYGAESAEITVSPSWFFQRLPLLSGAITVEYGFSEPTVEPTTSGE